MEVSAKILRKSIATAMEEADNFEYSESHVYNSKTSGGRPTIWMCLPRQSKSNGRKANRNEKGSDAMNGDGNARLDMTYSQLVTGGDPCQALNQT